MLLENGTLAGRPACSTPVDQGKSKHSAGAVGEQPCERASTDIDKLKGMYGGQLCLCGNIDLDSTLTLGTAEEAKDEVRTRISTVAPGGGYCCGSSNSVPEYVPFDNYVAMIDTVTKYGIYPISYAC